MWRSRFCNAQIRLLWQHKKAKKMFATKKSTSHDFSKIIHALLRQSHDMYFVFHINISQESQRQINKGIR